MDKLAVSLALILASAAAPAASLKSHCDAAESANAVYHLACLAGHIPCTQDVFERFWHDTLQWTAADQRARCMGAGERTRRYVQRPPRSK